MSYTFAKLICDEVFVINFEGYVGESTQREIEYAQKCGKTLRRFTDDMICAVAQMIVTQ